MFQVGVREGDLQNLVAWLLYLLGVHRLQHLKPVSDPTILETVLLTSDPLAACMSCTFGFMAQHLAHGGRNDDIIVAIQGDVAISYLPRGTASLTNTTLLS